MKKDLKTLNRSLALAITAAMAMTSAPAATFAADVEVADVDVAADVEEAGTEDVEVEAADVDVADDAEEAVADEQAADAGDLFADEVTDDNVAEVGVAGTPAQVTGLYIDTDKDNVSTPTLRWDAVKDVNKYQISVKDAQGVEYAYSSYGDKELDYAEPWDGADPLPSFPVNRLAGLNGYTLAADGTYEYAYADAEKTKVLQSMTAGKTYTISVRAVYYQDGKYTPGEWSIAVTYTVDATKTPVQIKNLRYSSEDDDNYYFAFDGNVKAGYVRADYTTEANNWDYYNSTYVYDSDDDATIAISKDGLVSGKTYYLRAINYVNGETVKDAQGNPVYSNVVAFTYTAKQDVLKTITGLTNYATDANSFKFRFDAVLEDEDQYELQYSTDVNFVNDLHTISHGTSISTSALEADKVYYVRAVTYKEESDTWDDNDNYIPGKKVYGTPSNVLTITKAKYPTVSNLAVAEKNRSGYKFKYAGSINSSVSGVQVWVSTDANFKNDPSVTNRPYTESGDSDNSFTIDADNFEPGKTYYVKVRAYSKDSKLLEPTAADQTWYGAFTNTVTVKPAVSKVDIDATVTATTIALNASPAQDSTYVTGYQFQKKSGKSYKNLTKNTEGSYTDKKLKQNTSYTYRVRAYYVNEKTGKTTYGAWKTYTTITWGGNLNLQATAKSKNSVKLTWNAIKGAKGYEVYRAVTNSEASQGSADAGSNGYTKWQLVKTIKKASTKTYTVKSLPAGNDYGFKVRAYKIVKNKKYYIDDTAYTSLDFELRVQKVRQLSNGSVKVTWNPVYAGNGYLVEKLNKDTDQWVAYKTITKASTSAITLPKATDDSVNYRIRAYKNGSPKEYTDSYTVTVNPTLATPTSVKASVNKTAGTVTVSWKAVAGADYYKVYRSTSPAQYYDKDTKSYDYKDDVEVTQWIADSNSKYGFRTAKDDEKLTSTSIVDRKVSYVNNYGIENVLYKGPQAGVKYYYYVVAYKNGKVYNSKDNTNTFSSGNSAAAAATLSKTTVAKTSLTSAKATKGKVNLKWKKVNGATGYVVYRSTKKGSGYTKIADITKGTTVKYTDKTVKKGKRYYYKVRAVKANEANVDVLSGYSAAKSVKAK